MSSVAHAHDGEHEHRRHHHEDAGELTPATWKDGKKYAWLLGLLVPTLPFIAFGLVQATGVGAFWFFGPLLVFVIFPAFDVIVGVDARNPPDSVIKWLEQDRYYRWCTYAYIPVQYAGLVFACWLWASGDLSVVDSVGLALTMAMVSGIAINTAHELGHKRASMERWLSKVALAQSGYGHFFIEHNRGHHVRVATPEDPASSRLGESFWEFLPRTVKGSLTSSWELERLRLDRLGARHVSLKNDIVNAWLMTVVLFAVLTVAFGPVVLPYLVLQAVFGFSLLEVVNYLEHYGLLRSRREDGRYERTRPEHSWNSNNVASNVLLYHLQRHSDHHANPMRRYQALRHVDEAPQLPTGYAGMIVLAAFPPLWRRVMDPKLIEHYDGDLTRATQPGQRLCLRRGRRAPARGVPGRHAVERGPGRLGVPRLRRARQGRLRARAGLVTAVGGATMGRMARTPYAVAARELLRDTLFDAARDALAARPWAEVTMAEIAAAAGVSRQTLYKEFGSRDEFAQLFVVREGMRFLAVVEEAVRRHLDDPRAALEAALGVFLTAAAEDPVVSTLLHDDGTGGMLPLVTTQSQPVVTFASSRLTDVIRDGWPQVRQNAAEVLSECLVRLAISYAILPKDPPEQAIPTVMALIEPYVAQALASASA